MTSPGVVAFGEVGLDCTVSSSDWESQQQILIHLLLKLQMEISDKLTVLPYWEVSPWKVEEDLLGILQKEVQSSQLIHIHYFHGTQDTVCCWLKAFSNIHISVGGAAVWAAREQRAGLERSPKDQLLLESDSPYAAAITGVG